MEKGSKIGGRLENERKDGLTDVEKLRYMQKWPFLRFLNFFSKRNFDTGYEISSVGITDFSVYTKSEQLRIAGKHLTRLVKNGYAAVAI